MDMDYLLLQGLSYINSPTNERLNTIDSGLSYILSINNINTSNDTFSSIKSIYDIKDNINFKKNFLSSTAKAPSSPTSDSSTTSSTSSSPLSITNFQTQDEISRKTVLTNFICELWNLLKTSKHSYNLLRLYISQGLPLEFYHQDKKVSTALHYMAYNDNVENYQCMKFLLEKCRAHVNSLDSFGFLPIHYSCYNFHPNVTSCVSLLLAYGSSINIPNQSYGRLPIHIACFNKSPYRYDIVEYLLREAENQMISIVDVKDSSESLPIHYLCNSVVDTEGEYAISNCFTSSEGINDILNKDFTDDELLSYISKRTETIISKEGDKLLRLIISSMKKNDSFKLLINSSDRLLRTCLHYISKNNLTSYLLIFMTELKDYINFSLVDLCNRNFLHYLIQNLHDVNIVLLVKYFLKNNEELFHVRDVSKLRPIDVSYDIYKSNNKEFPYHIIKSSKKFSVKELAILKENISLSYTNLYNLHVKKNNNNNVPYFVINIKSFLFKSFPPP